ncbi:GNAT family N-acetyltransferase [Seonamhaeicola algicola]|uniref:GNAT family N-acetyltransferase n=1 Tax=Seonamhaeicola algicola TaxID=1719036 RepID=A0A5C7ASG9_9FLAO|nr:GNAT family N-acetyltransferase [Seonamhaeicola algicola]TXE11668.1 GNAT family N-acetyltransferase [Seonamhaeicola algicola]
MGCYFRRIPTVNIMPHTPTNALFTTAPFLNVWNRHFNNNRPNIQVPGITGLFFFKPTRLPLLKNTGATLTHGVSYGITANYAPQNKQVHVVYDVPEHAPIPETAPTKHIGLKKIKQYPGYVVEVANYASIQQYMHTRMRSKSRWKLKRAQKRLETCFNIRYEALKGHAITESTFIQLFESYYSLLEKRTLQQQRFNHWLLPHKKAFLKELLWTLLKDHKAIVFVIYKQHTPISVTFNYLSNTRMILGAPVFDTDFEKFNLGYIGFLKQLAWCIDNHIETFDFSKGHYNYKKRLADAPYLFYHHIIYNKTAITSRLLAGIIATTYRCKQWLREQHIDQVFNKWMFTLKHKKTPQPQLHVTPLEALPNPNTLLPIDYNDTAYAFLKPTIYNTLFAGCTPETALTVFKTKHSKKSFILQAQTTYLHIQVV